MKDFSELFADSYNNQQEQWEKTLQAELKLDDISTKTAKSHLDLGPWPTLSLSTSSAHQLKSQAAWKKASQSYLVIDPKSIARSLEEDLESGVRAFFFDTNYLSEEDWKVVNSLFEAFAKKEELEVYLLGPSKWKVKADYKLIEEKMTVHARSVHASGGHNVHELAVLVLNLIEGLDRNPEYLCVYMDSHFFKNIAKVRALKLLSQKVMRESKLNRALSIMTLNSYREWTLYERYSNMLRNNVQVASGYISGAEAIQSSGYQLIFDLETDHRDPEHNERSLRMARNTSHILGMESMLGLVEDASYGSFHLESLTNRYAAEAWTLMQKLLPMSAEERGSYLEGELQKVREVRLNRVKTRKDVLTGMNDYPDGKENLNIKLKESKVFRVARDFEAARLKVESLSRKPKVQIILQGDYGSLNNRINFIKNFFELIGLEVIDPLDKSEITEERVIVLCAKDEDYPDLAGKINSEGAVKKYVAGRVEVPGFEAIYGGQNIFDVLSGLVKTLEARK